MFLEAKDNVKFLTTLERHFKVTPSINRIKEISFLCSFFLLNLLELTQMASINLAQLVWI
jgi:hypothetical protein